MVNSQLTIFEPSILLNKYLGIKTGSLMKMRADMSMIMRIDEPNLSMEWSKVDFVIDD